MRAVDAHCHLEFDRFDGDREEVIERSRERLEFVVNAGSKMDLNRKTLELAERYPEFVVPALGLHPTYTGSFDELQEVKELIRREKPAAVGEIGLDYHHVTSEDGRRRQEEVFTELVAAAEKTGLPVVVHSRDAEKRAVEILAEHDLEGVHLHSFNGTPGLAREAAEQGMTIGVSTQVLYSSRVRDIVSGLSLESIVLETDSPFLYRGERNEPLNVLESAGKIAEIMNMDREEVIEETTRNARDLFG